MVARGGIEPPTRGFSGCKLSFPVTGRVHEGESIQGVPRKQGEGDGSSGKLGTGVVVQMPDQMPVQMRPNGPRRE